MADRFDVVVIGAGFGGLSAATALASRGLRVAVCEAATVPGGKAGVSQVDGCTFDTGPSLFTLPEVLASVAEDAGVKLHDLVTLTRLDPAFRYLFADGSRLDLPAGRDHILATVRQSLGPRASRELAGFLDYSGRIWQAAYPTFIAAEAPTLQGLSRHGLKAARALACIDPLRSMARAIDAQVRDPHLRMILRRFATYNGSDPRRAPATLNCIAHVEMELGAFGVQGGLHQVAQVLSALATRRGATFLYDNPVQRIEIDAAGRVCAVHSKQGTLHCQAVVVGAEVRHLQQVLLPQLAPPPGRLATRWRGRPAELEPSTSGWTAVIRARRRQAPERIGHTVLFASDYNREFADLFDRQQPPDEPTLYLCAQEKAHQRSGWAEHEPLFLMVNAPAERPDRPTPDAIWQALKTRALARARAHGLLDPGDSVVWERSPADLAARFPGSQGALYGAASNDPWAAFRRPANRHPRVPGLYLASGTAHPGGGVPLCLRSGQLAAQALWQDRTALGVRAATRSAA